MKGYLQLEKEQLLSRVLSIAGVNDVSNVEIVGKIPHLKIESNSKQIIKELDKIPSLTKIKLREKRLIEK